MIKARTLTRALQFSATLALPLLLTHCAHHREPIQPIQPHTVYFPHHIQATPKMIRLANIDHVALSKQTNAQLTTNAHHQAVVYHLPHGDHDPDIWITGHTLHIGSNAGKLPIHITVDHALESLTISGNAAVTATKLQTKAIHIIDTSNAPVIINGVIDAKSITASNAARLKVMWINSPNLTIYANKNAFVDLAGVTKNTYIRLENNARLDAQFLRANTITASAFNNSRAKLFPINSFQGFGHDTSIQYLYHQPNHINKHTWDRANIFNASYRP